MDVCDFSNTLRNYYEKWMPLEAICKWLVDSEGHLEKREINLTVSGNFKRFCSYPNFNSLRTHIVQLLPEKLDVGAIYDSEDQRNGVIVEKELFFDIDADAYDNVRTCCTGKTDICEKCWIYLAAASHFISYMLENEFGFKQIIWIFSGRRGIHGWVCDTTAKKLSEDERASIVCRLDILRHYVMDKNCNALHSVLEYSPLIRKFYSETLLPIFETTLLDEQQLLGTDKSNRALLQKIPNEILPEESKKYILNRWTKYDGCAKKCWSILKKHAKSIQQSSSMSAIDAVTYTVLLHLHPRLDVAVSKQMNHLLKMPFCVHPSTKKLCLPLNMKPEDRYKFNPNDPALYLSNVQCENGLWYIAVKIFEQFIEVTIKTQTT